MSDRSPAPRGILTGRAARTARGILTGILTGALALTAAPSTSDDRTGVIIEGLDVVALTRAVTAHGGSITDTLETLGTVVADVPADRLPELAADPRVGAVTPDTTVLLAGSDLDDLPDDFRGHTPQDAAERIGGKDLREDSDWDGTGIDVAVIDSGVQPGGALAADRVELGVDLSVGESDHRDGFGHGTAMASLVAGHGGSYEAVGHDARIIDVKVADDEGMSDVSQVLAGIDWVVSNRDTDGRNIRVLSLSFGTNGTGDHATSPLARAVESAWRHGIVVVVSAGNHGATLGRLSSPAIDPFVIAVGAADVSDVKKASDLDETVIPVWSAFGDGQRNPDFVAPGRSLLSARSKGSKAERENPNAAVGDYIVGSGTSQATAFTAGIVAAVLEARPSLTPDQVKAMLIESTEPLPGADARQVGNGVLNLEELFDDGELRDTPTGDVTQDHGWSNGQGSLDGDRGAFVLADPVTGRTLEGDLTVTGLFDRVSWTGSTWSGSTWSGSTWSGSTWSGSTWSGSTWSGSTWSGSTWSANNWSGSTWSTSMWE